MGGILFWIFQDELSLFVAFLSLFRLYVLFVLIDCGWVGFIREGQDGEILRFEDFGVRASEFWVLRLGISFLDFCFRM